MIITVGELMTLLKKGSKGLDVRRWQQFLVTQGYRIEIDDDFGKDTHNATIDFQAKHGLETDGKVGHDTYVEAAKNGFNLIEPEPIPIPTSKVVLVRETTKDHVKIFKFDSGEAVFFTADMMVDADGCPLAYHPGDTGIESIANSGGLKPSIVVYEGGNPYVQQASDPAPGYYVSMTSWEDPSASVPKKSPKKYLDALKVSYVVVPGGDAGGAKTGNAAMVINLDNGKKYNSVVGDTGPREKAGEASMQLCGLVGGKTPAQIDEALARKRGSVCNPRNGGPSGTHYRYIMFPNVFIPWGSTQDQVDTIVSNAWSKLTDDQRNILSS